MLALIQDPDNSVAHVAIVPPYHEPRATRHAPRATHHLQVASQLVVPMLAQFPCTPLHLLGLDFYNRNNATMAQRSAFLAAQVPATIVARSIRMLPAWGFGGIINIESRKAIHRTARGEA